jgi:NADH:ubiquinone oxidoreductase subunit F (NADH-binding)
MASPRSEHWLIPARPYASWAEYLSAVGSSAAERARAQRPEAVLDEIRRSGLRGRGGAGFPTGTKWRTLATHPCETRFVVCNAAEGEPGTFKDRWLLRHNPYAVLEGMLAAAHVIGARECFVAAKASFGRELDVLSRALDEMDAAGVLAGVDVRLVEGPEEYLFGEEKALLNVIDGEGPLPREPDRPPYELGLRASPGSPNPALVNNAQTFAHASTIVRHGAASFRALGTEDTPGTLIFTVSGDVQRPGVYELPAGVTLRQVFQEAAGGPRPGRRLKAALCGVSHAVLLADRFDVPADFGHLHLVGAGLGAAGFVVFDDQAWMPRVAQAVARFLYVESCNQCSACKAGLRTASGAIDELFDPALATNDDPERALYAARSAPQGTRCYLPVQGSIVVPSLLRAFQDEFDAQLRAPAGGPPAWPIPKIVDFDAAAGRFVYDEHQAYKQPDWTYREAPPAPAPVPEAAPPEAEAAPAAPAAAAPPPPSVRPAPAPPTPRQPTAVPAAEAAGAAAVWLRPDLAATLVRRAHQQNVDLDRLLDAALREWLKEHPAP